MFGSSEEHGTTQPSLDVLQFDVTRYEFCGEPQPGRVRVWNTADGDGLGVYFFARPPDLPADLASNAALVDFYRKLVAKSGGRLVEAKIIEAAGRLVVRTISSTLQHPAGRTYVGSLALPFRDFSYVLRCQCFERGPIGVKAALLLGRNSGGKRLVNDDPRFHTPGAEVDDPRHDAEFPHEPVARARRTLDHLAKSLTLSDEMRRSPGFPLPPVGS